MAVPESLVKTSSDGQPISRAEYGIIARQCIFLLQHVMLAFICCLKYPVDYGSCGRVKYWSDIRSPDDGRPLRLWTEFPEGNQESEIFFCVLADARVERKTFYTSDI